MKYRGLILKREATPVLELLVSAVVLQIGIGKYIFPRTKRKVFSKIPRDKSTTGRRRETE